MDTPKFCKDCKFWNPGDRTGDDALKYAKCSQQAVVLWNSSVGRDYSEFLATGILQAPYCSSGRLSISPCGPDGLLFEPKDPTP